MDLDDLEHNTRDGLHVAALAGTWIAFVAGLAGLRERGGTLAFAPRLPAGITQLVTTLTMRQRRLRIEITPDTTTYRFINGEPLRILHDGRPVGLSTESPALRPTQKVGPSEPPTSPFGREPLRRQAR
jgi:alpha,alpha-trehalose phosphorylase